MRPDLRFVAGFVAGLCLAAHGAHAAQQAEYAIRWNPAAGGPASAKAALAALGLEHGDSKAYVVRYYEVAQPPAAPPGFRAVARERESGQDRDATYKLRGADPPPDGAFASWACPLKGSAESKREVDVGWTGDATPRRNYSLSCTADTSAKKAFPKALAAVAGQCTSRMERTKAGAIKLERWTFADGTRLFEVSTVGKDDPDSLEQFRRRIVEPLVRKGVKPLRDSKTELGSAC